MKPISTLSIVYTMYRVKLHILNFVFIIENICSTFSHLLCHIFVDFTQHIQNDIHKISQNDSDVVFAVNNFTSFPFSFYPMQPVAIAVMILFLSSKTVIDSFSLLPFLLSSFLAQSVCWAYDLLASFSSCYLTHHAF